MRKLITKTSMILLITGSMLVSCKKDKKAPITASTVTTTAISNLKATSATGGGNITSNGGTSVTASGLCYSKTNSTPTTANDTTLTKVAAGTFTSGLKNLTPSSTFYVRAYATNSMGTGYGDVVTFITGNGGPTASNVAIAGKVEVGETLTATYTYSDTENDAEDVTTFQWYRATDATGTGEVAITGATTSTYKLVATDEFKFIRVGITPKAKTGTTIGTQVKSSFTMAVAVEPTTVTFTYNGKQVTYGIITSSVTGHKWLDRNLGAPNAPSSFDDWANYGDLFQWGRGADGHQLITRASTNTATKGVNGTTTTLSTTDAPGHSLFIIITNYAIPRDWRSPQNNNLWGVNGTNNPCPQGWHIPTAAEWDAEKLDFTLAQGYNRLKITKGGSRAWYLDDGEFNGTGSGSNGWGPYWSSTIDGIAAIYYDFETVAVTSPKTSDWRASGNLCRCIKN